MSKHNELVFNVGETYNLYLTELLSRIVVRKVLIVRNGDKQKTFKTYLSFGSASDIAPNQARLNWSCEPTCLEFPTE